MIINMQTKVKIQTTWLGFVMALLIISSCNQPENEQAQTKQIDPGDKIGLKVAGYDLDRLKGIVNGSVPIEGCEVEFHKIGIGDANTAAFSGAGTYDVTEIGLGPFMLAYANDNFRDYTLIPVFPIRTFRHKSIFIRNDGTITGPADLKGKKIGTPGYSSTSLTWIRGMLKDEYGVDPEDITWVLSNKDSSADVAGKTGTTQRSADNWFVLMHPNLVSAGWVGFNKPTLTFRTSYWGQGAHNALFIVSDFFKSVLDDEELAFPDVEFMAPEGWTVPLPPPVSLESQDDRKLDADRKGRVGW